MATPYESARLILQLYEMRRETTMREARDYFLFDFDPASLDELLAAMGGPKSGLVRMVVSYWEMATSLVVNGAIDEKMFNDANGEQISVFAKMEPLLPAFRERVGNPNAFRNLETVVMALPNARERVDGTLRRIRGMAAARAAANKA